MNEHIYKGFSDSAIQTTFRDDFDKIKIVVRLGQASRIERNFFVSIWIVRLLYLTGGILLAFIPSVHTKKNCKAMNTLIISIKRKSLLITSV